MVCKHCGTPLPPPKPRGRPRMFCSGRCKSLSYGKRRATVQERFATKHREVDGHWIWTGTRTSSLYGMFFVDGSMRPAHRVSYELHVGPIPDGMVIDHLCGVKRCVRPDHLEAVTSGENRARWEAQRGTAQSCPCTCCHH